MLNQQEVEVYKKQLEVRRSELFKEISDESQPVSFGGDIVQAGEEKADEAEEFSNQLAVAQTLREEIQEIDNALERIRKGTYGTCERCGKEISKEVLAVAPESALCEDCKTAGE